MNFVTQLKKVHHENKIGLRMSSNLEIVSRNMDLTPSLKTRVEGKIGKVVEKLGSKVKNVQVVLKVFTFPLQGAGRG